MVSLINTCACSPVFPSLDLPRNTLDSLETSDLLVIVLLLSGRYTTLPVQTPGWLSQNL